jgi:starvation-inducible DNA-binding protein
MFLVTEGRNEMLCPRIQLDEQSSSILKGERPMAKTATATVRMYKSSVGTIESNRQATIALLNARLADSVDLRSQVKWAHWNVKGMHFMQLHLLFDSVAGHLEEHTDTIAERIVALGGVANGTARESAAKSGLKEADLSASDGASQLKWLVHNVAHHANALRQAVNESDDLGDKITSDLFTSITRELDKDLWFLEAHLQ